MVKQVHETKSHLRLILMELTKPKKFYIICDLSKHCQTYVAFTDRQKVMGVNQQVPHITLMTFVVPPLHQTALESIFNSKDFLDKVSSNFKINLKGCTLVHIQKQYEIFGDAPTHKFYGKKYFLKSGEEHSIGNFRKAIYAYLVQVIFDQFHVNITHIGKDKKNQYYGSDNDVWYQIPSNSHGHKNKSNHGNRMNSRNKVNNRTQKIPNFTPHMSIFNLGEIEKINYNLYSQLIPSRQTNGDWDDNEKTQAKNIIHQYIGLNMQQILQNNGITRAGVMPFSDLVFGTDMEFPKCSWK
jgi:hypothetical protein